MANFSISYIYQIKDKMSPTLSKISKNIQKQNHLLEANRIVWGKLTTGAKKYANSITSATHRLDKFNNKILDSTGSILALGAGIAALALPVKKAVDFETAMTSVAKAANLERGTEEFAAMKKSILDMSLVMPIATNQIADMAAAGARLGINNADLPKFVELTAKTSVAFDLMGETAGDALASIGAKMNVPISGMESMMDAVNTLENNTAAKGKEMINIIGRIAGTAKSIELKPEQTAGLAAFANQITVSPELAASGLNMMINRMQKIPALQKQLLKSPEKAIQGMLKSLAKVDKASRAGMITKIFGDEAGRFVTQAVGSLELYEKTLGLVADKSQFAGSMTREYTAQIETTGAALQLAQNATDSMWIAIGDALLPATKELTYQFIEFTKSAAQFVRENQALVVGIAALVAGFVSAIAIAKVWQMTMLVLTPAVKAFTLAVTLSKNAIKLFNLALRFSPIGLILTAVGLLAGALAALAIDWDAVSDAIGGAIDKAKEWAMQKIEGIGNWIMGNDDETESNVNPKITGADASRASSMPQGNVDIAVTGTNAKVTGMNMSGQGLTNKGMVEFSSLMN